MRRIDELIDMHECSLDHFASKGDVADYWNDYYAKETEVLKAVNEAIRYQRNI